MADHACPAGVSQADIASLALRQPDRAGPPARWSGTGPMLTMSSAVAFSGKAIIVMLAYRHGVDAITLITLITVCMLVALPFFLAMVWWTGRGRPRLGWRERGMVLLLGEPFTAWMAVGSLCVLAGVTLLARSRQVWASL